MTTWTVSCCQQYASAFSSKTIRTHSLNECLLRTGQGISMCWGDNAHFDIFLLKGHRSSGRQCHSAWCWSNTAKSGGDERVKLTVQPALCWSCCATRFYWNCSPDNLDKGKLKRNCWQMKNVMHNICNKIKVHNILKFSIILLAVHLIHKVILRYLSWRTTRISVNDEASPKEKNKKKMSS